MKPKSVGLTRDTLDKFYTNPEVAYQCIEDFINEFEVDEDNDVFIEPSAGNGSFSSVLFDNFKNVLAYDISPGDTSIVECDFLELKVTHKEVPRYVHVIGNPPFGRQSSIAKKFISKCSKIDNIKTISFILPKSFKKESMQKAFPLEFHLIFEKDLAQNSFTIGSSIHDVPCVFQVWSKKDDNSKRVLSIPPVPVHFKFVKKNKNPDFSLRRVGVYAGKLYSEIEDKSEQSHYFITIDHTIDDFVVRYNDNVVYDHNNTVGPRSVSKPEVTKKLNDIIEYFNLKS